MKKVEDNIPKVIHYCWFGRNEKPELLKRCIASWKKFCPDYEIIEWNEDNFDICKYQFAKDAYDAKKYAFVSDIARLAVVYEYGGFYLDTDVELYKSLDELLEYDVVFAFESNQYIASGLGFGAVKSNKVIEEMLKSYKNKTFSLHDKKSMEPCPQINTEDICRMLPNLILDGTKTQVIDNCLILSMHDYSSVAKHWYAQSWVEGPKYIAPSKNKYVRLKNKLRKSENFLWIEKHLGKNCKKIYVFIAYDLLDCGIVYFIKRFIHNRKKSK